MAGHAPLKFFMTKCSKTQIRLTRPILKSAAATVTIFWTILVSRHLILGFLGRNLYACPQGIKAAAYKGLVRPVLEYSGSVSDPSGVDLKNVLEKIQNRAARFATGNYNFENGSMTGILEHLKWESLKKRRRDMAMRNRN